MCRAFPFLSSFFISSLPFHHLSLHNSPFTIAAATTLNHGSPTPRHPQPQPQSQEQRSFSQTQEFLQTHAAATATRKLRRRTTHHIALPSLHIPQPHRITRGHSKTTSRHERIGFHAVFVVRFPLDRGRHASIVADLRFLSIGRAQSRRRCGLFGVGSSSCE